MSHNVLLNRLQCMSKLNKSSSTHGKQDAIIDPFEWLIVLLGILKITCQHTSYQVLLQ